MKNQLFFLFFLFVSVLTLAQTQEPRLVIPIGHTNYYQDILKADNLTVTCEKNVLILWSMPYMKEVYRKTFDESIYISSIIGCFEQANVILLKAFKNKELVLLSVDYLMNQYQVFQGILTTKAITFPKLNTIILGNADTTYFFDIHNFELIGRLPINIWVLNSFSKANNQFGVNSKLGIDYILYRGSQKNNEESSLIVYNQKNKRVVKLPLGCNALKAMALDNGKFLIEKEGTKKYNGIKSSDGFYKTYVFDVNTNSFIDSLAMHKYSILAMSSGLSNEFLTSGGDKKLIFYNQNLDKIREFNISEKLNIPIFRRIEVDTILKTINFESAIYKRQDFNEKTKKDSILYTGKLDYYTLELIDLNTEVIKNDSMNIDYETTFNQKYSKEIYGKDVPLNLYRQDSSGILLNGGTIRITNDFKIIFQDSITLIPEIELNKKDIQNIEIINKTIPDFNSASAKVFKTVFSSNQLNDIAKNYKRLRRKKSKSKLHLKYEINNASYDSIYNFSKQMDVFTKKPNQTRVMNWFQNFLLYSSPEIDSLGYIHYYNEDYMPYHLKLLPFKTNVYFGKQLMLTTTDQVSISSNCIFRISNSADKFYAYYKKNRKIHQLTLNNDNEEYKFGSGSIIHNDSVLLFFRKGKLINKISVGENSQVVAVSKGWLYFRRFNKELELKFDDSTFLNLFSNNPNSFFYFIDTITNEEKVKKIDFFELKIAKKKFDLKKVDELNLEQTLDNITPEKINSRKRRVFEYGDIRLSTIDGFYYELVKANDTLRYYVKNFEGELFELSMKNDLTGGEFGPLLFTDSYKLILQQLYNFVEVPNLKKIYSNRNQNFLDLDFKSIKNEELIGVNEKFHLLILLDKNKNIINVRNYQNCLVFSIIITEGNNYLFVDNESRYDGSKGAIDELYFLCGLEIIELNQVKDSLFVPHLVMRILQGDEMKNLVTLKKLNICGITPIVEQINNGKIGSIKFRIIPRLGGLGCVELFINGISRKIFLPSEIALQNGIYYIDVDSMFISSFSDANDKVEIKLIAKTANYGISSRGIVLIKNQPVSSSYRKPSLFAVMIGIDDYKDNNLDLNYAAKDANDFHSALEQASKKFFNVDDTNRVFFYNLTLNREGKLGTDKIKGKTPDKANINQTLEEIEKKSKPEDILLVFFAGHGEIVDKDQLLLLTTEATSANFEGIRMRELLDQLNKIPAGKRVLILDACHSGAAINNLDYAQLTGKRDVKDAERQSQRLKELDKLASKSGFAIITASSSDQKALELPQYEHGLMTYALLNAMLNNKNSLDENSQLQLDKWLMATEEEVKKLNQNQSAERMVPVTFTLGKIDDEVRSSIVLKEIPTVFVENVLNRNSGKDNLNIKSSLSAAFQELSRGSSSQIMVADFPNAVKVNILYEEKGDEVKASIILYKENFEQKFELTGKKANISAFVQDLMNQIRTKFQK